jgi:hypothetical protein
MKENFKYDAFIAYAGPDAEYANKFYNLLSVIGHRVFLDSKELLVGDPFSEKIGQAQKDSLLTVVLISNRSDSAYFEKEEILRAIELARDAGHRVVPVYLTGGRSRDMPLPLSQLHSIYMDEESSLLSIAQKIEAAIENSQRHHDWQQDIDPATIIIVTGCHHLPELYDRPCAYELKKTIDRAGDSMQLDFLHSVVMSDIWLKRLSDTADYHNLIGIGSPAVNSLSGKVVAHGKVVRPRPGDRWQVVRSGNRWALFGHDAEDTHKAVISFKKNDLPEFLEQVWSEKKVKQHRRPRSRARHAPGDVEARRPGPAHEGRRETTSNKKNRRPR